MNPVLLDRLHAARHVVVFTGAGVSAESGMPTYRDARTGLWENVDIDQIATIQAFERNPAMVWNYWSVWLRELALASSPNAAHLALVELERRAPKFTLITQNVDGLHQRAGSRRVIELHGSISYAACVAAGNLFSTWPEGKSPPRCPECGALLRPAIVLFGEKLPENVLEQAMLSSRDACVFMSIGTSGIVNPAAQLPYEALQNNAILVEINPHETALSRLAHYSLRGSAAQVLPELVARAWPE